MKNAYRVAIICGILPLLAGVLIFLLWLITRWSWLMTAGVLTIWVGMMLVFIGTVALIVFLRLGFRAPEMNKRQLWCATLGAALLFFSNFLVAGGIIATVAAIETRYTVTIHNTSLQPLNHVVVIGGGCEINFGNIQADSIVRRSFRVKQDGELEFHAVSDTTNYTQIISDYISNGLGGHTKVVINPNKTLSIFCPKN